MGMLARICRKMVTVLVIAVCVCVFTCLCVGGWGGGGGCGTSELRAKVTRRRGITICSNLILFFVKIIHLQTNCALNITF